MLINTWWYESPGDINCNHVVMFVNPGWQFAYSLYTSLLSAKQPAHKRSCLWSRTWAYSGLARYVFFVLDSCGLFKPYTEWMKHDETLWHAYKCKTTKTGHFDHRIILQPASQQTQPILWKSQWSWLRSVKELLQIGPLRALITNYVRILYKYV